MSQLLCFGHIVPLAVMRQLKGKTKESARERKQRKQDFLENKDKLFTVALPAFAAFWIVVALVIYYAVQPKTNVDGPLYE